MKLIQGLSSRCNTQYHYVVLASLYLVGGGTGGPISEEVITQP